MGVGGDISMDNEKMRIISAAIMLATALIQLLRCILWVNFP